MVLHTEECGETTHTQDLPTVVAAAVRVDGVVYSMPPPNRHHNILYMLHHKGLHPTTLHDQGFVLSDGTYANRREAFDAAAVAGQALLRHLHPGGYDGPDLYSEDLW